MVTAEELARVEAFTALGRADLERLAHCAADLRLVAGEWAAFEGGERALFAVLEGRIEAVKQGDGGERIVGGRGPGDVFGEVPLVFGTPFPVGFRAAGPARVMRVEARDYQTVAATAPALGHELARLAAHRMGGSGGLQSIASAPPEPRALLAGRRLDPACVQLRRFLDRNQVAFRWITPDDVEAEELWGGTLPRSADTPALRLPDGRTVLHPELRRAARLLGLTTEAAAVQYDVVVVGAGPAGLAAAVYGASEGLRTVVVEREAPGGQAGTSSRIENYLGFPSGISGDELASRALQQARRLGAEILVTRSVTRIDPRTRAVHLDGGDVLQTGTVVLACGVAWRRLEIEGFDRLAGKGISYGAARSEASNVHGLDVHIVGAGNSAGQAAMFFSAHARRVTLVCRGESLEKSMSRYLIGQLAARPNVQTLFRTEVVAAHGYSALTALDLRDAGTGEVARHDSNALFIFIGANAETGWLPPEIALDRHGYVLTGADVRAAGGWTLDRDPYLLETSVPGVLACGDVRSGPVKRVAAAVGEGSMAIAFVHRYLAEQSSA